MRKITGKVATGVAQTFSKLHVASMFAFLSLPWAVLDYTYDILRSNETLNRQF